MKRVNVNDFYTIGAAVHPLTGLKEDDSMSQYFIPLANAKDWMKRLIAHPVYRMRVSMAGCEKLYEAVSAIIPDDYSQVDFKRAGRFKRVLRRVVCSGRRGGRARRRGQEMVKRTPCRSCASDRRTTSNGREWIAWMVGAVTSFAATLSARFRVARFRSACRLSHRLVVG